MLENLRQYLGIPYQHHGRTGSGMDCYGIISHMYQKEQNIQVKDFPYGPVVTINGINNLPVAESGWKKVTLDDIQPFDILIFKNIKYIGQVGIYVGNNKFIHTSKRTGSIISTLNTERRRRLLEIYRWAG